MKKHPGIWFTIISLMVVFFLPYILTFVNWHPKIEQGVIIMWSGMTLYGITTFHVKWIESNMRKQLEKDRKNGNHI